MWKRKGEGIRRKRGRMRKEGKEIGRGRMTKKGKGRMRKEGGEQGRGC